MSHTRTVWKHENLSYQNSFLNLFAYRFSRFGYIYLFKTKKRENLHLLLVPPIEALALPYSSKRATRKPHADMYIRPYTIPIITTDITKEHVNIPTEAFTVALFLTNIKNLRDSNESKPKRQVNAFSYMSSSPCYLNSHKQIKIPTKDTANVRFNFKFQIWNVNYFKANNTQACTITMTKPFSTIYANTPWQVLHSPPRICQRGWQVFL